jgi:Cation transporter/ATPase, N-terminus
MEQSFLSNPKEILKHFAVKEDTGLSEKQILVSRARYGSNGMQGRIYVCV